MAGGAAPPLFFRSLRDFFRVLPGAAQRFWVLVIATGALSRCGTSSRAEGSRELGARKRRGRDGDWTAAGARTVRLGDAGRSSTPLVQNT
jgi:hypothetical protein